MDLRNFESTSTYAIEAVYRDYWLMLPEKYRLMEKAQRQEHGNYDMHLFDEHTHQKTKVQEVTPLSYKDVEQKQKEYDQDNYANYCNVLNDPTQYFDLQPFFDPQLDFENRLHYKLSGINYLKRKHPWFVITWNCGQGVLKSSLTNRLFGTNPSLAAIGEDVTFNYINSELDLTLCFTSNSLQGLFELQENIRVGRREKAVVNTRKHSILGSFPVSLYLIDSALSKLDRSKGTLCTLTLSLKLYYVVIGNIKPASTGIIKEIHMELDRATDVVDEHILIANDIITEDS